MFRCIVGFCFWFTLPLSYALSTNCLFHKCLAVVDAGSTGTRVHLYEYDLDKTHTPIHIKEVWTKKINPGFASIKPDSNTIKGYLDNLLSGVTTLQKVPLYFYSTAGMRLLPPSKQKIYYRALKHWFFQQKQWQLMRAKTITGNEEAVYDWLAVNYQLGTLLSLQDKPIGVMDMGGASVQIVFPVDENKISTAVPLVKLTLYGQPIQLYVRSFLGLGQNEMAHQFLNSPTCFAYGYPLPDGEMGQGNASSCKQELLSLVNGLHEVDEIIKPVLASNPMDVWYVLGGLTNLVDNKIYHFENNELTNEELLQQADSKVCQQSWDSLNALSPGDEYLYAYCLFSSYYYALMVDGYGIAPEQTIHTIPPKQNMDWTKGVVLQQRLARPHRSHSL